jgi:hypothetical protein
MKSFVAAIIFAAFGSVVDAAAAPAPACKTGQQDCSLIGDGVTGRAPSEIVQCNAANTGFTSVQKCDFAANKCCSLDNLTLKASCVDCGIFPNGRQTPPPPQPENGEEEEEDEEENNVGGVGRR